MGKSMLGKIKGLFYEPKDEGVESEKKEPVSKDKAKPAPQQPAQTPPLKKPTSATDEKEADNIYKKLLSSVLEEQSLLTQFRKVTESIFETITDKGAGYKAAFAAISGITNATVEELIDSINSCISKLANEEKEFQEKATTHRQEIDDLKQQLEYIDQQIAELEEKRRELNTEILEGVSQVERAEIHFNRAKKRVESELNEERLRVTNFLQGGGKR